MKGREGECRWREGGESVGGGRVGECRWREGGESVGEGTGGGV